MSDIDNIKKDISKELTSTFIDYQYRMDLPIPTPYETYHDRLLKYQSDPIFRAKVDSLVAGIMHIVGKYIP